MGAPVPATVPTIGTLEAGKAADLIAVDGDPLQQDVRVLKQVVFVMKGGQVKAGGE